MLKNLSSKNIRQIPDAEESSSKLLIFLVLFFLLLLIPGTFLAWQAVKQIISKGKSFNIKAAEEISLSINNKLKEIIKKEEQRPVEEYNYFVYNKDTLTNKEQIIISPLASKDKAFQNIPGLISFFQISSKGKISIPSLPNIEENSLIELNSEVLRERKELKTLISFIIGKDSPEEVFNFFFEPEIKKNISPKKVNFLPQALAYNCYKNPLSSSCPKSKSLNLNISKYKIKELQSGYMSAFRVLSSTEKNLIQGFIFKPDIFFLDLIKDSLSENSFSRSSKIDLFINNKNLISFIPGEKKQRDEIVKALDSSSSSFQYNKKLLRPFSELELSFLASNSSSSNSSLTLVLSLFSAILMTLSFGTAGIYKLGKNILDFAKQRSNFIAAVSHELKTPLTSIRLYSEMLQSGIYSSDSPKAKTKRMQYYEYILLESERLTRLINNILSLSSIGNQSDEIIFEKVTLKECEEFVEEKISGLIKQANFELKIKNISKNFQEKIVEIDKDKLAQIVINLSDNAVKFAKNSEPKIVELDFKADEQNFTISIRDYGPGISKENISKIFNLFYRAEDELIRSTPGTGIGLALVSEISSRLGASIEVENIEENSTTKGAKFSISLAIVSL